MLTKKDVLSVETEGSVDVTLTLEDVKRLPSDPEEARRMMNMLIDHRLHAGLAEKRLMRKIRETDAKMARIKSGLPPDE